MKVNCAHLSKPSKTELINHDAMCLVGPLLDLNEPNSQKGFDMCLHGRTMSSIGACTAVVDSKVISEPGNLGESHVAPSIQSLNSDHNQAIMEACLCDRLVHVFITDKQLPSSLREDSDGQHLSWHLSPCRLGQLSTRKAMFLQEIKKRF